MTYSKILQEAFEIALNEDTDLSKIKNTMTNILSNNVEALNKCKTKDEVYSTVKSLLDEHNIDTEASRRLLLNIAKSKTLKSTLEVVWNSILKGSGEGVINRRR